MTGVAVLGAGFMGSMHAAAWKALEGRASVVCVCSRSHERAARLASDTGAMPIDDVDAAIAAPGVDIVDVCLPTPLHRDAAERAFAAGKHVLLEKPVALTADDADAILDAARRSGRLFMVALVLRFWPEYVELQRRVAAGELGTPLAASTERLSPPADWNEWMADPALSGGVPVDLLVHDFDQTNWLFGRPRAVFARTPRGNGAHVHALVEYESGDATIEGSMGMPASYPFSSNIRVVCEGGVAEYGFTATPAEDGGNIGEIAAGRLRFYPSGAEPRTIDVPDAGADPFAAEIAYFLECVENDRMPEVGTGEQARDALLVSLAANRSLASGRPEPVSS